MLFERQSWRDFFLFWATRCLVHHLFPRAVVLFRDHEFNGVVACGHSRHVPVKLRDLASLEEVTQRDREQECDEDVYEDGEGHLLILCALVLLRLNARVLYEDAACRLLGALFDRGQVEIRCGEGLHVGGLSNAALNALLEPGIRGLARQCSVDRGTVLGQVCILVHTIVENFANSAEWALHVESTDFDRDGGALHA